MPDPSKPYHLRRSDVHGVGPYRFVAGADFGNGPLSPGESATLDVRDYEENGTKGYYVVLSEEGYDEVQVINRDTGNPVALRVNDGWDIPVEPSSIQSDEQVGMYRFTIVNEGTTDIAAGSVVVTIEKSAYGADDRARKLHTEGPIRGMVRNFIGI